MVRLVKAYEKLVNQRNDFLHKLPASTRTATT
jgi:hypothetical protein